MSVQKYIHQPLGQEVEAIAGRYVLVKELRLPFAGQEVLCLIGQAAFDTACCGAGGCGYAVVPGFIRNWKKGRADTGEEITAVEPVAEEGARREIEAILKQREGVHQVNFW